MSASKLNNKLNIVEKNIRKYRIKKNYPKMIFVAKCH